MNLTKSTLVVVLQGLALVLASSSIAYIPEEYTYLLPAGFVSGNDSTAFVGTETYNITVDEILEDASDSSFIVYDKDEFAVLFGSGPEVKLLASSDLTLFTEGGAWVVDRNEVWFSGQVPGKAEYNLTSVNLETGEIRHPTHSLPIWSNAGITYFNGLAYTTNWGNDSLAPSIVSIDPNTGESKIVVNSFYGLRLNGPDDLIWVKRNGSAYLFFTDPNYAGSFGIQPQVALPNAVWRLDPTKNSLQAVISRADVLVPNGVAANANGTKLYITDTPSSSLVDTYSLGAGSSGSKAIFEYDLDASLRPVNKRLIGLGRDGDPDGIKVDDFGRIWTGETEGVVVRTAEGKILGIINAAALGIDGVTEFALCGDLVVIGGHTNVWTVQLAQNVLSWSRYTL